MDMDKEYVEEHILTGPRKKIREWTRPVTTGAGKCETRFALKSGAAGTCRQFTLRPVCLPLLFLSPSIVSLVACLGAGVAVAETYHHKPAVVTHRNRVVRGNHGLTWSQMPPCHNKYITGVPCITSYDFGCWKYNDDDPVEHCGNGKWPVPLGQQ
jgi:hypothetical protein